jgi:hypothetical protein
MKRTDEFPDKKTQSLLDQLREVPGRAPSAQAAGRAAFLKQVGTAKLAAAARSQTDRKMVAPGSRVPLGTRVRFSILNTLVAAVLAIILLLGTASTVYAAQGSLPDEALYPLKTFSEDALLALTPSSQAQLSLTLEFTDRRLAEMAALQSRGVPIPSKVVDRYQNELDRTLELAAGLGDSALPGSLDQVSQHANGQLHQLNELEKNNPGTPALTDVQMLLRDQIRDANLGKSDPQGFRQMVHGQEPSDTRTPDMGGTPSTPGNGAGGNQPGGFGNPGQNNPGSQQPTKTPKDHGSGFPDKTREPGHGPNNKP